MQYGTTALMYSASDGRPEIVKILIAAGADVNAQDIDVIIFLFLI